MTPELAPERCLFSLLLPSMRPPGVHLLGPDPERPGYELVELVSDDGRQLQPFPFPRALSPGKKLAYMWWWRDLINAEVMAHRCPDCPERPGAPRRRPERMA